MLPLGLVFLRLEVSQCYVWGFVSPTFKGSFSYGGG